MPFQFFSFQSLFLDGLAKVFGVTKIGSPLLDKRANYCVYDLKFCMCKHDMPCALKINSNGGLKRGHVESCLSTTKDLISPLPQCLWPPNLAGWCLVMRSSYPKNRMTFWPCGYARLRDKQKSLYLQYLDGLLPLKSLDSLIT